MDANPVALIALPMTTARFGPNAREILADTRPNTNIITACGSNISPDWLMVVPKPYPASWGSVCKNSGTHANGAYIPTPTSNATRFVVHTPGRRIMCMSISGTRARRSDTTQTPISTTPPVSSPITTGELQPQACPWLRASKIATSQPDNHTAGKKLMRPGVRTGDSGINNPATPAATAVTIAGSQDKPSSPIVLTIGPATVIPRPEAAPISAEVTLIPKAVCRSGNSSRIIPKARGRVAPPASLMTRPISITARLDASAATT